VNGRAKHRKRTGKRKGKEKDSSAAVREAVRLTRWRWKEGRQSGRERAGGITPRNSPSPRVDAYLQARYSTAQYRDPRVPPTGHPQVTTRQDPEVRVRRKAERGLEKHPLLCPRRHSVADASSAFASLLAAALSALPCLALPCLALQAQTSSLLHHRHRHRHRHLHSLLTCAPSPPSCPLALTQALPLLLWYVHTYPFSCALVCAARLPCRPPASVLLLEVVRQLFRVRCPC
jgi:hypothetical protein